MFPAQAGGGLYNFHETAIEIKQMTWSGGGSCVVRKVIPDPAGGPTPLQQPVIATLDSSTNSIDLDNIFVLPGEYVTFVSSGATTPCVAIVAHEASYAADGH